MSTPSTVNPALEQFIRSIPLFSLVQSSEVQDVLRLLRPVTLKQGDLLFLEGEPGRSLWVLTGQTEVAVGVHSSDRVEPTIVANLKGGDVVGEMALVDDGPRAGTAAVTVGGPAHQIDAQDFYAIRGMFLPAAFKILRQICVDLCARLRATDERIVGSSPSGITAPPIEKGPRPDVAALDGYAPFRPLPAVVKLALAQKLEVVETAGVVPLFAEGEATDGAYFILEGEVTVGRNGKTLAHLGSGQMFGVVACIDHGTRTASCVTTGPARLLRMSDNDFDQLFAMGHRVAYQMVDLVARQLVQHVRNANAMLPRPGADAKILSPVAPPIAVGKIDADVDIVLDMADALPIGVELDIADDHAARDFI